MKLRNKRTGEIIDDGYVRETHDFQFDGQKHVLAVFKGNGHRPPERVSGAYKSLAELNDEWEDYEEPKEYWCVDCDGMVIYEKDENEEYDIGCRKIGNYFLSREEAEKAVEKLKAWKRLKDKGFRFIDHIDQDSGQGMTRYEWDGYVNGEDLDLLFGGEE